MREQLSRSNNPIITHESRSEKQHHRWAAFGIARDASATPDVFESRREWQEKPMNQPRLALLTLLPFFVGIDSFGQGSPMFRGSPIHSGIYAAAGVS